MKYRPEIDGLRAIAVMPVIFFHAGLSWFSGGYVGVDVFFVISGYLITTIIIDELSENRFSIVRFYERRARRILPALFFVLASSLPFAWLLLVGKPLQDYIQSLVSVNFFVSNFFYWSRSGYFETASELLPFLHTWSLAVEEQFYIFFPIILGVLWRFGTRFAAVTLLIMLLSSLGLSEWASTRYTAENFFLAPTRAWELLIGVLAAFAIRFSKHSFNSNNPASLTGLALILFSVFAFDETTPFPGRYALAPTIGAVLIILYAGKTTIVGKLLSRRGFVGIGLISYSTYLWHQPLLAFSRLANTDTTLTGLQIFILISAALGMGWFSWKFIETPFRNKQRVSRKQIFTFAAIGGIVLISLGFGGAKLSDAKTFGGVFAKNVPASLQGCAGTIPQDGECTVGAPETPEIAILGDSHAMVLANYMGPDLEKMGLSAVQLARTGCIPVQNLVREDQDGLCKQFNDDVFRYLTEREEIKTVILSARWTLYMMKSRFDNQEGGIETGKEVNYFPSDIDDQNQTGRNVENLLSTYIQHGIQRLLDEGKRVILVYPVPEAGWDPERIAVVSTRLKGIPFEEIEISTSYPVFKERNSVSYAALDSIPENPRLFRMLPEKLLCDTEIEDRCMVAFGGKQYYRDDDHLGQAGAELIIEEIVKILDKLPR